MLGNNTKGPLSQTVFRAKQPLKLIHADLHGPITPSTPSRNRSPSNSNPAASSPNKSEDRASPSVTVAQTEHGPIPEANSPLQNGSISPGASSPLFGSSSSPINSQNSPELYENSSSSSAVNKEPANYKEAKDDKNWKDATKEELESIERNGTWSLIAPPKGAAPIDLQMDL
ncbi:hypothetical protein E3N88_12400 [Mikania micrantha]|uniref:Uncharacterized protein n=1 Tax=Mikania micrantha TaxID=192012 RepID=A0A5N6P5E3_9ASTR|nr:hypothetical protein E3N88_12400 [Mikania micrantha]